MTSHDRIPVQRIATTEPFFGLSRDALAAVAHNMRSRCIPAGSRIFNQGDDCPRAHAVIEGAVRISQTGSDGAQVVIRFVGPGEMFGTVGLFTGGRYPAEATTLSDTLEASWSGWDFSELLVRYPPIARNVICVLSERLQGVQDRARELATQRAEQRVAQVLLRLLRKTPREGGSETALPFPLRRKDIADVAGTTLHTASRILSRMERVGILETNSRRLIINDPGELCRIAEA